jgi:hypothetical protein
MTNKEEVLGLIKDHPEGLDDDDISDLTGIKPRQQIQQLCNQLAATNRIRRESVEKNGKRRKIHNFPANESNAGEAVTGSPAGDPLGNWKRRLSALIAATGRSEDALLDEALYLLAMKVLRNAPESE